LRIVPPSFTSPKLTIWSGAHAVRKDDPVSAGNVLTQQIGLFAELQFA
jgi:hypothetical protein